MRVCTVSVVFAISTFVVVAMSPAYVRAAQETSLQPQQLLTVTPPPFATSSGQTQEKEHTIDITQTTVETKSKLAAYLDSVSMTPRSPLNIIQHAIRNAVNQGVPANILVLLLLFPVTASLIAIFRHIIGLRGFGIYTPAVIAVAFISTGIVRGLILFLLVFTTVMVGKSLLNRLKLQYLPRTALLLWFVSCTMFGLLLLSPYLPIANLASVGIFPLLVLILLSENFLEAQISGSLRRAIQLTIETLVLATISAVFMRTLEVQKFVIIYPEFTILAVLCIDIIVGKYTGLRVSEFFRFQPIIDPEE
ncbi:MAG: hypothetical protein HZA34_03915 [Candidatus Pacebacteria bacterium]|nr:hypothetical protein [Candidatus Paceibacterota bacterium]